MPISIIDTTLHNGKLVSSQAGQLKSDGWLISQSNVDFTDIEYEETYLEASPEWGVDDRCSFNLSLTFSWQDRAIYCVIGANLGDGVINDHEVKYKGHSLEGEIESSIEALRKTRPTHPLLRIIDEHGDHWSSVVGAAAKVPKLLQISSDPA